MLNAFIINKYYFPIVKTPFGGAMLTKHHCFSYQIRRVFTENHCFTSETQLFPTPALPADPADPPDPADQTDPSKMLPEPALRPSLPHAPGVRMT